MRAMLEASDGSRGGSSGGVMDACCCPQAINGEPYNVLRAKSKANKPALPCSRETVQKTGEKQLGIKQLGRSRVQ